MKKLRRQFANGPDAAQFVKSVANLGRNLSGALQGRNGLRRQVFQDLGRQVADVEIRPGAEASKTFRRRTFTHEARRWFEPLREHKPFRRWPFEHETLGRLEPLRRLEILGRLKVLGWLEPLRRLKILGFLGRLGRFLGFLGRLGRFLGFLGRLGRFLGFLGRLGWFLGFLGRLGRFLGFLGRLGRFLGFLGRLGRFLGEGGRDRRPSAVVVQRHRRHGQAQGKHCGRSEPTRPSTQSPLPGHLAKGGQGRRPVCPIPKSNYPKSP